jgi:hypothetical protein
MRVDVEAAAVSDRSTGLSGRGGSTARTDDHPGLPHRWGSSARRAGKR